MKSTKPRKVSEAERREAYENYDRITARNEAVSAAKSLGGRLAVTPFVLVVAALFGGIGTETQVAYMMVNAAVGVAMAAWVARAGIRLAAVGGGFVSRYAGTVARETRWPR
jgi:hypothetical protein